MIYKSHRHLEDTSTNQNIGNISYPRAEFKHIPGQLSYTSYTYVNLINILEEKREKNDSKSIFTRFNICCSINLRNALQRRPP